ncbi:MAG: hypothetical protein ACREC3_14275 [Methyloceanibacter sp.]
MQKRSRLIISTSVLVVIIGAIFFAGKPQPSSGQVARADDFRIYQLEVYCNDSGVATAIFKHEVTPSMGTKAVCVGRCDCDGKCGLNILIADELAKLHASVAAALMAKVEKHERDAAAGTGRSLASCGLNANPSADKSKPKCEEKNTPPWFDTGAKCDDKIMFPTSPTHRAETHLGYVACHINYTLCGTYVSEAREKDFPNPGGLLSRMSQEEAYEFCASKGYGRDSVPYRTACCKKWDQAYLDWLAFRKQNGVVAPGHPCNPFFDADCDGKPNREDQTPLGDCADYRGAPTKPPVANPPPPRPQPVPVPTQTPLSFWLQPKPFGIYGSLYLGAPAVAVLPGELWEQPCMERSFGGAVAALPHDERKGYAFP